MQVDPLTGKYSKAQHINKLLYSKAQHINKLLYSKAQHIDKLLRLFIASHDGCTADAEHCWHQQWHI